MYKILLSCRFHLKSGKFTVIFVFSNLVALYKHQEQVDEIHRSDPFWLFGQLRSRVYNKYLDIIFQVQYLFLGF